MDSLCYAGALIIIAFGFMLLFKKSIASFLDRAQSVSKDGITALPQNPTQIDTSISSREQLLDSFNSALILQKERELESEFEKRNIQKIEEKFKIILRHYAAALLLNDFQRTDMLIFGSQIELLIAANTGGTAGVSKKEAELIFGQAQKLWPGLYGGHSFDDYVEFVTDGGLLEKNQKGFSITQKGKEFLSYLIHSGRTQKRAF